LQHARQQRQAQMPRPREALDPLRQNRLDEQLLA
jgi:hypothetical protein